MYIVCLWTKHLYDHEMYLKEGKFDYHLKAIWIKSMFFVVWLNPKYKLQ